jgi:hypothetical protein
MSNHLEGGVIALHCPPNTNAGETWGTPQQKAECESWIATSTTKPPSSTTVTYATTTAKATATTASQPSSTTGAPTTLSSSLTTIACAIPEGTPGRIVFEDGSCKVQQADVPWCQEDEPCWDCHTMGNHICGTATSLNPCGYRATGTPSADMCNPTSTTAVGATTQPSQSSTTHAVVTQPVAGPTVLAATGSQTPAELGFAGALFAVAGLLAVARKVFKPS